MESLDTKNKKAHSSAHRSRTVHWALDVNDNSHRPFGRTRRRKDSDADGELWWSQGEVLEFRRHRDRTLLHILRENPDESRMFLHEFTYDEVKSAFQEDLRRIFMRDDEDSPSYEHDSDWMRQIEKIQRSWKSIHILIRSRGNRLR